MSDDEKCNFLPFLDVALKEWEQTIEEAKIYFEGEKEIIKQTILVSLTSFFIILTII